MDHSKGADHDSPKVIADNLILEHGIHIAIHGYDNSGHGDPYRLGPPPSSFGWGAIFVIRVKEFDRYYGNALREEIEVLDSDLAAQGKRYFVVKDPSGYVLEMTEEEPRGLEL